MKAVLLGLSLLVCWLLPAKTAAQTGPPDSRRPVTIGVVIDGPGQRARELLTASKQEIVAITKASFAVAFPDDKVLVRDGSPQSISEALDQLMADEQVDLVLAHGVLASNLVLGRGELPKPCVAPFVVDEHAQGLVEKGGKRSAIKNLSYIAWSIQLERDLAALRELGTFDRIAWVHSERVAQAIPNISSYVQARAKELNATFVPVPAGSTAKSVLEKLPAAVDAVYVGPNPQLDLGEIELLAQGLIERRLPSFSWFGRHEVRRGLLAGVGSDDDMVRLTRRVALNVQSILLGDAPESLVTAFKQNEQLVINMETARALGLWPNFGVLTDAVLLGDKRRRIERRLSLETAISQAMSSNLELSAMKRRIAASREEIRRARSYLLPRLALTASASWIDADRAGLGSAERMAQWGGVLQQQLINEPAWANLAIQRDLHRSVAHEEQQLQLDITEQTAVAYLNLLGAQTVERIQRENLSLSRENLALAKLRHKVGSANPGEVLRWETQIATARTQVIRAIAQRNQLEMTLNRLLHRPLEEAFVTREAALDDPSLIVSDATFRAYLNNPFRFKVLREFLVEEGVKRSPELKQLDAAKRATKRRTASAKRSLYIPKVGLSANVNHHFYRGGEGSEPLALPPGLSGIELPNPDRVSWFVGVSAELPLYEGGARYSAVSQSEHEHSELVLQRKAVEEAISLRIRSRLHQAGADFAAIRLSQSAAEAARESLDLVADAYSRGTAPTVALLDAQNEALVAELAAVNSVYQFLATLMQVQRAVGSFELFSEQHQRQRLLERLDGFQQQRASETNARPAQPAKGGSAPSPLENGR